MTTTTTTTSAPDLFRMGGKKLRWYAQRGPIAHRADAAAEIARRAGKREAAGKPPVKVASPARKAPATAKVTRMGDTQAIIEAEWNALPASLRKVLLESTVSSRA